MALVITKTYAAATILTEAQVDNFRNALLAIFNTTKLDSTYWSLTMALTNAQFSGSALTITDNTYITFGASLEGKLGLNAAKDLVFDTTGVKPILFKAVNQSLTFRSTRIDLPGDVIGKSGAAGRSLLQVLSLYQKPVLEYASNTAIRLQNNTSTTNETMILMPYGFLAITESAVPGAKYRYADISVSANGINSSDTGAARGGRRSALGLTTNTWYYVYLAKVTYGTDVGDKFIIVFDDTSPEATNYATLNTRYGTGQWAYVGLVRYGYGAAGSTSRIVPFVYSNKGWCYFTANDGGIGGNGVALSSDTNNTDGVAHTIVNGISGQVIPTLITHGQFNFRRDYVSQWTVDDGVGYTWWQSGWTDYDTGQPNGYLIQLPIYAGMRINQIRHGTGSVNKMVVLTGFHDSYILVRKGGKGV